jgi:hypothetical protein
MITQDSGHSHSYFSLKEESLQVKIHQDPTAGNWEKDWNAVKKKNI